MLNERNKQERLRRHVVEELIKTESSYVDKLGFLKGVRLLFGHLKLQGGAEK